MVVIKKFNRYVKDTFEERINKLRDRPAKYIPKGKWGNERRRGEHG